MNRGSISYPGRNGVFLVLQSLFSGNTRETTDRSKGKAKCLLNASRLIIVSTELFSRGIYPDMIRIPVKTYEERQAVQLLQGPGVWGLVSWDSSSNLVAKFGDKVLISKKIKDTHRQSPRRCFGASNGNDKTFVNQSLHSTFFLRDALVRQRLKDDRLGCRFILLFRCKDSDHLVFDVLFQDQKVSDLGEDTANDRDGQLPQCLDQQGSKTSQMKDQGNTRETISNRKFEVGLVNIVIVLPIESLHDNVSRHGGDGLVARDVGPFNHAFTETVGQSRDTLMDLGLKGDNGSLGEVRVDVSSSGAVVEMIHRRCDGVWNGKTSDSRRVFVDLASATGVNLMIVTGILHVNFMGVDTNNRALLMAEPRELANCAC